MNKRELPIQNPCQESWEQMRGGPTVRHCAKCDKDVHNLSAMTRREAQAVIDRRASGARLCVRYAADFEGQLEFRREALIPAGLLVRGRRLALGAGLSAAVLGGCLPGGSVVGSATSHQIADELGERGTCSLSLEPLLPFTIELHAARCAPRPPEPALQGQLLLPEPPLPVAPQAPPRLPPQTPIVPPAPVEPPAAPAVEVAAPKRAQPPRRRAPAPSKPPAPRRSEIFMGEML
jgi:hypothetical protein